jgi:hypothetical protein
LSFILSICLSFFPERRLYCYIYFQCLPVTTAIISLTLCSKRQFVSLSLTQDLGLRTYWAECSLHLHRICQRPVLPRNVIGRIGRFCRGTSSDGRTDKWLYTRGCPWPMATVKPMCEIQVPKLRSHILKITS